jgi:hypothetical protein
MVAGTRAHAEGLREEVARVLVPMGMRLSEEKTRVVHIDGGFDFSTFSAGASNANKSGAPPGVTSIPTRPRRLSWPSVTGCGP